jgi:hypothetical protein
MKIKFLLAILLAMPLMVLAQDNTPGVILFEKIVGDIMQYGLFVLALYEIVVRFFPTVQSYSLLTQLIHIIEILIPDRSRSTEGAIHAPLMRAISINDVQVGDMVKTKQDEIVKILDIKSSSSIAVGTEGNVPTGKISIDDIVEIMKQGYALVNIVKSIVLFLKQLFAKKG